MSIILLAVDLIQENNISDAATGLTINSSIDHIRTNTLRIIKIANNMIDIADAKLGRLKPRITSFDAVKKIRDVTSAVKQIMKNKYLRFDNISDRETLDIQADEYMFERILLNLLSNALKHAGKDGKIDVASNTVKAELIMSVKDNGKGIRKEIAERIFKRIIPVDEVIERDAEGLGIGLSLVKTFTDMHNGRVWFDNKPGYGSTFYTALPIQSRLEQSGYVVISPLDFKDRVRLELADIQSEI